MSQNTKSCPDQSEPTSQLPDDTQKLAQAFVDLVKVVECLRGPQGCPWDLEQTQKTLVQYAIEEAYELAEAIESGDQNEVCEELGDYLFQVILQAQVAKDEKNFELLEVIEKLSKKMIYRHPHVFEKLNSAPSTGPSLDQVWLRWDQLKADEQKAKAKPKPVFSYPRQMPALQAAHKIGIKTQGFHFDWDHPEQVFAKIEEEVAELKMALQSGNKKELQHEIGDVLFSVAQFARHLELESESCLREGNRRFEERFNTVLSLSSFDREEFRKIPVAKKEELWNQAKHQLATERTNKDRP
jgi:tetrapyrrole methylase family protein/MazG family protein